MNNIQASAQHANVDRDSHPAPITHRTVRDQLVQPSRVFDKSDTNHLAWFHIYGVVLGTERLSRTKPRLKQPRWITRAFHVEPASFLTTLLLTLVPLLCELTCEICEAVFFFVTLEHYVENRSIPTDNTITTHTEKTPTSVRNLALRT